MLTSVAHVARSMGADRWPVIGATFGVAVER
jgi:hypothetical protein